MGFKAMIIKRIGVFLGSSYGAQPEYEETTRQLGQDLAARHLTLVFGGSDMGLMSVLANSVLEAHGQVVGVIPRVLAEREIGHRSLTEMKVVPDLSERKRVMAELSDAFIALPGGLGTLDEIFEMVTWTQLGMQEKPCGLLDVNGYYDDLWRFMDRATEQGFIKEKYRGLLIRGKSLEELLLKFESFTAPA
jgi:uncharacterized protein (TIGR00730 family)